MEQKEKEKEEKIAETDILLDKLQKLRLDLKEDYRLSLVVRRDGVIFCHIASLREQAQEPDYESDDVVPTFRFKDNKANVRKSGGDKHERASYFG